jgi:CelD/BcsL family acetyltransferase involved in cellulose biosynthesis
LPLQALQAAEAAIQPLVDLEKLRRYEASWDSLAYEAGSPMQQYIWAEAFAETFGAAARLRVLTVGPEEAPWALAPLVERPGLSPSLETLSFRELFEPMDLVYAGPAAAWPLAEALVRQGKSVSLPRLPATSPVIPALRAAFRGRGVVIVTPAAGYPYIRLDASWMDPECRFNAGRRSDIRRARRHAERLGEVTFQVRAPSELELPTLLEDAWRVEAAGWKGARRSALACDERRGSFFRRYALAACRKGILRLCFMRIGGRVVAMQFAAECANRFWLLKIGHDEGFARCAPGNLLMLHTVGYAAQHGLESYEFLGAVEDWTGRWTRSIRECVAVRAYPFTAPGLTSLASDGMRYVGRRLAQGFDSGYK